MEYFSALTGPLGYVDCRQGAIQVLRQQRGGWVGSENGKFCCFTVLFMLTSVGGWA